MTIHNKSVVNRSAKAGHVGGIDSVRALAALSVVLAHIAGPELPNILKHTALAGTVIPDLAQYIFTGHPAIIAFLVVSGFCIHYPYVYKPLPILPFWAARWIRIMIPALVAMLLAKLNDYNFWDGYILWSIVCELFYYMCYPFFLWVSRWMSWRGQFCVAMLLSFFVVAILGSNQYGSSHIYGPLLNWIVALPSWLAGCVLADHIYKQQGRSRRSWLHQIAFWRVLVAMVASLLYWATMNTVFGFYLTMNGFALLVYLWIEVEVSFGSEKEGVLEWVGKWSYSIYLLHMPLLLILARILGPFWNLQLASIPLVLWGAFLLYQKVELPSHAFARSMFKSINPRGIYVNGSEQCDSAGRIPGKPESLP